MLKKCLTMKSPKHSITANIEGNVIDIIYIGEQEINTVLKLYSATYSMLPGQLLTAMYLALTVNDFGHLCIAPTATTS